MTLTFWETREVIRKVPISINNAHNRNTLEELIGVEYYASNLAKVEMNKGGRTGK